MQKTPDNRLIAPLFVLNHKKSAARFFLIADKSMLYVFRFILWSYFTATHISHVKSGFKTSSDG